MGYVADHSLTDIQTISPAAKKFIFPQFFLDAIVSYGINYSVPGRYLPASPSDTLYISFVGQDSYG